MQWRLWPIKGIEGYKRALIDTKGKCNGDHGHLKAYKRQERALTQTIRQIQQIIWPTEGI